MNSYSELKQRLSDHLLPEQWSVMAHLVAVPPGTRSFFYQARDLFEWMEDKGLLSANNLNSLKELLRYPSVSADRLVNFIEAYERNANPAKYYCAPLRASQVPVPIDHPIAQIHYPDSPPRSAPVHYAPMVYNTPIVHPSYPLSDHRSEGPFGTQSQRLCADPYLEVLNEMSSQLTQAHLHDMLNLLVRAKVITPAMLHELTAGRELFDALSSRAIISKTNLSQLRFLLQAVDADAVVQSIDTYEQKVPTSGSVNQVTLLTPYTRMLLTLSHQMTLQQLKFLIDLQVRSNVIYPSHRESIKTGWDLFTVLEQRARLSPQKTFILKAVFQVNDADNLVEIVQQYEDKL